MLHKDIIFLYILAIRKSFASPSFIARARFFLLADLQDFLSDLGSGTKKKSSEKLTYHFQSFFNISRTNSKTSKVNQQSVLNL